MGFKEKSVGYKDRWVPAKDESYFYLDDATFAIKTINHGLAVDTARIKHGNCFRYQTDAFKAQSIIRKALVAFHIGG